MTEETIFATALDKQAPAERSAFLDEACGRDAALRQRVVALLEAHDQAADFLEKPAVEQMAANGLPSKSRTEAIDAIRPAGEGITSTPGAALPGETQAEPSPFAEEGTSLDFLSPSDRPGALGRLGHYHVLGVIGRGGMGVVLKAFDEELQRVVAIKVMTAQMAATGTARKRFRREAQAAAAVRDEHVIDIHGVDEVNGLPYLVMEFVGGISLQDRIDQHGPLELKEILRIGMQTANGLAKAHAQGLIHRDIKPANILLENGVQRVKITDFGLARAVDDASLTQSGVIAGTPQYMAPEQARAETVDHRADLFSLGSVLYAMGTGHSPFRASSTMAVLKRVCDDTPRPIREINPDIPDWLTAIIAKLHAKDPAQRFQSAQEVAQLLGQHLLHLQQPDAAPLPPPVVPPIPPQRSKRSRAWPWLLVAACLMCLLSCVLGAAALGMLELLAALVVRGDDIPPSPEAEMVELSGEQQAPVPAVLPRAVLAGHVGTALAVAFSPDRKTLATADRGGTIYLWDTASGKKLTSFPAHDDRIPSLAYSPDGKVLASASWDHTAKLWDATTPPGRAPRPQATLKGHSDRLWWVAFASDSKTLATAGQDGIVLIWDTTSVRNPQNTLKDAFPVYCAAFGPGNKLLATGTVEGIVRLWDTATWQHLGNLEWHFDRIRLAFSPDGKILATGSRDMAVGLWDVAAGQRFASLTGFRQPIESVAFSPDGKLLATVGGDRLKEDVPGEVTIWEVATRKQIAHLDGHASCVYAVAFSPDGKTLATASNDCTVKLWDVSAYLTAEDARAAGRNP